MSTTHVTDINGQYSLPIENASNDLLKQFTDDEIIAKAYKILEKRALNSKGEFLESPDAVKKLFQLRHSGLTRETFDVAFLTQRHTLIEVRTIFVGSVSECSVYPREIIRAIIETNCCAIVLSHGHPSNISAEPSRADIEITAIVKKAIIHTGARLLDHIVTTDGATCSLAERGEV